MTEGLNKQQKDAVLSDKNTVVKAGAGSGKTTVLALRYVRLITENMAGVEHILTVTFTRKAAAEMYERIYTMLRDQVHQPCVAEQLAKFSQARISTLDSFCTSIVREYAGMYGITPTFVQDQHEISTLAEQTALSFIVEHQEDSVIQRLIRDAGFEPVWKELFSQAALTYLPLGAARDFPAMYAVQQKYLQDRLYKLLSEVSPVVEEILSVDGGSSKAVKNGQESIRSLPDVSVLAAELDDSPEKYQNLKEIIESCTVKMPGRAGNPEVLRFKELAGKCRELFGEISVISGTLAGRDELYSLFQLFEQFQTRYHREKRSRGVLSYQDVQEMAVTILRSNPGIRDYYKQKYRYIMIDEFQDNNALQKELLYLLAERQDSHKERPAAKDLEEGKLFFVGDEKQSIYRFRGADVSVFRELGDELQNTDGALINLTANYRSEPGLVEFYNTFFPSVFQEPEEDYEARFEPLEAGRGNDTFTPRITLFYKPFDPDGKEGMISSDDAEAYYLASAIKQYVENQELQITSDGKTRYAEYDDIAILIRSTSNQVKYERMLRRFDVPYVTGSVRTLFLEAPVNDIYTLLQLAVYPEDRTAYAGLLRSPLVAVSDSAVVRILLEEALPFCWEPAEAPIPAEDLIKYRQGRELYHTIQSMIDTAPITDILAAVWYHFGYRYTILNKPAFHGYLEFFDYLWHLAYEAETRGESAAEFLDFIRENLGKYERLEDMEMPKDIEAGVHIMTAHKAKGLEFPVVFLANMGNTGRKGEEKRAFFHISDTHGLTFNLPDRNATGGKITKVNYFYDLVEEENRSKECAELKRLLYVGATRAKCHLFLSGVHNRNNRSRDGRTNCLLNLALDSLGLQWQDGPLGGKLPEAVTMEIIGDVSEEELQNHTGAYRKIDIIELSRVYENASEISFPFRKKEFSAIDFDKAELPGPKLFSEEHEDRYAVNTAFGTLCHYILEQKIGNSYNRNAIPSSLLRDFPEADHDELKRTAELLVERFFSSALGEKLSRASIVETELPFLLRREEPQGEVFINGRVDLYFEAGESGFVVDFKTDQNVVPEIYTERMSVYREALHSITGKPSTCFLYYLRHSRTIEL